MNGSTRTRDGFLTIENVPVGAAPTADGRETSIGQDVSNGVKGER
jgi:hypothetical protein